MFLVLQPIHDYQTNLLITDSLLLIGPLLLTQIKLGLKKVNQQWQTTYNGFVINLSKHQHD